MSPLSIYRNKFARLLFSNAGRERRFASVHDQSSSLYLLLSRAPFATAVTCLKDAKSPTIAYLVDKCGLSSKSASSVSKRFKLQSIEKTDSVLQILRDRGFSDAMIADVVCKHPFVLSMKTENLKLKLDWFRSVGFSDPEITEILSANIKLFSSSLEKTIAPSLEFTRTFLSAHNFSDHKTTIIRFLKYSCKFFMPVHADILKSAGVPEQNILNIFLTKPRSLVKNVVHYSRAVEKVKEFGVEPKSLMFHRAVDVLCGINHLLWDDKMNFFKSLGWSTEQICTMFKWTPYCFALSEELIKKKMDFFSTKLGWDTSFVAKNPVLLQLGIEKRFVPRFSVLNILMSKGLIIKEDNWTVNRFIVSDKIFHKQYVKKFEKDVTEITEAFGGKIVSG